MLGNISSYLAEQGCKLGMDELIYIAKQGSLTRPEDLYTKIYSSTSYLTMSSLKTNSYISGVENSFVKLFPELDTGCHISVPTVLEEDYYQREIATKQYNAQSIDNEISQIANCIYQYNQENDCNVKYFNMHFATDYVRRKEEKILKTSFDLANNRTKDALSRKQLILSKIGDYFSQYIIATSV